MPLFGKKKTDNRHENIAPNPVSPINRQNGFTVRNPFVRRSVAPQPTNQLPPNSRPPSIPASSDRSLIDRLAVELPTNGEKRAVGHNSNMNRPYNHPAQTEQQYQEDLRRAQEKSRVLAEKAARAETEKARLERIRNASKDNVRYLRELIREKYQYDLAIWNERCVLDADKKLVLEECRKADAILQKIYFIVNMWEKDLFDSEEWRVAKRIKEGLSKVDHVIWADTPPWDFTEEGVIMQPQI